MAKKPQTVLLVNMGGPGGAREVAPYLRAIFADPMILPMPGLIRRAVGEMIVTMRTRKVIERYRLIGGKSPLKHWTERLIEIMTSDMDIRLSFRYTSPTVAEAMAEIAGEGIERVTLLPLFPHGTRAMTGSIRVEATRAAARHEVELRTVPAWGLHPAIVRLQAEMLEKAMEEARRADSSAPRVLFVAHGIPLRDVARGDDYPVQVQQTAERLAATLPAGTEWTLAYQSKVGPVKWTQPYMEDELERLAGSAAPVVIMPLSFVADCLETLYDLDLIAAPMLKQRGVRTVVRVPVYNDDPRFAQTLLGIVKEVFDEKA